MEPEEKTLGNQRPTKCLGLELHENWLEWRLGVQRRSCMRGSELAKLALGIWDARCQEGESRCYPPRHHEFGEEKSKLLEGSQNSAQNSVERKKRKKEKERRKEGRKGEERKEELVYTPTR